MRVRITALNQEGEPVGMRRITSIENSVSHTGQAVNTIFAVNSDGEPTVEKIMLYASDGTALVFERQD